MVAAQSEERRNNYGHEKIGGEVGASRSQISRGHLFFLSLSRSRDKIIVQLYAGESDGKSFP